jgi:hypothetical protein
MESRARHRIAKILPSWICGRDAVGFSASYRTPIFNEQVRLFLAPQVRQADSRLLIACLLIIRFLYTNRLDVSDGLNREK